MKSKTRNMTFQYIYAIMIVAVVDLHAGLPIDILTPLFPFESGSMALFVFVSGYFYKKAPILRNLAHRAKRIYLPYLLWSAFAWVVTRWTDGILGTYWAWDLTPRIILCTFLDAPPTAWTNPAWFMPALFWLSVIYNVIRNILPDRVWLDGLSTAAFLIVGFAAVQMSILGYSTWGPWHLFIIRTAFFIQFYHYGVMFRKYLEAPLRKWSKNNGKVFICLGCILLNIILICKFGSSIRYPSVCTMNTFSHWYLPLITFITATVFFYEVAGILASRFGPNPIVNFLGNNTATIIETHLLFLNLPNLYCYLQCINGNPDYAWFDAGQFVYSAWYRPGTASNLMGFVCGMVGSCLVVLLLNWVKKRWLSRKILRFRKSGTLPETAA